MYTHNEVGPWPIIDPSASKIVDTTIISTYVTAVDGTPLRVRLDTANLGSNTEGFVNYLNSAVSTLAVENQVSFGVALTPLENVNPNGNPIYLDINMAAWVFAAESANSGYVQLSPFVGFIDTAGAAIGNGWNANNLITNYCLIPSISSENVLNCSTQIVIKDSVSGQLDLDKFLVAGLLIRNIHSSTVNIDDIEFSISARYATKSIITIGRGV
jgi:hypothetical protein